METIIKQTNDAYVIIPSTPAGLVTGEQLAKIAQLVNESAGLAKFTTGQRIAIITTEDKIDAVRSGLESVGLKIGPAGRTKLLNQETSHTSPAVKPRSIEAGISTTRCFEIFVNSFRIIPLLQ